MGIREGWRASRSQEPLKELLVKVEPWHLVLAIGALSLGLAIWLALETASAANVVIVSFLGIILALVAEGLRQVATVETRVIGDDFVRLCSSETDTVDALSRLDKLAHKNSHVKAVWGALGFGDDGEFAGFVRDQLKRATTRDYKVERWIDTSKVDEPTVNAHLKEAEKAIKDGRYHIHLICEAPFGALVLDADAAAINFPTHSEMAGVLGVWGKNKDLASSVSTMIHQLEPGTVLPGTKGGKCQLSDLEAIVRDFYEKLRRRS